MENIEVTDLAELEPMSDFLHDSDIDIETVEYDRSKAEISVIFRKELWDDRARIGGFINVEYSVPVQPFVLTISNVVSYDLNDTEKIGCYDLCQITFDPVDQRIGFDTGVPLHFVVNVSGLKMRLDRSSNPPETVNRRRLSFL